MSLVSKRNYASIFSVACCVVLAAAVPARANISFKNSGSGTTTFEDPANWTLGGTPVPGETVPPGLGPAVPSAEGSGGTWFIEGAAANNTAVPPTPARPNFNGTVTLSTARDGSDADHPKLGVGSVGGGLTNEVTTLLISTNATFTGVEHNTDGTVSSTVRQFRVGQSDFAPGDQTFPWGVVKQTHGTVLLHSSAVPQNADIKLSADKVDSAGGIWEVGGDSSLIVGSDIEIGDKTSVRGPGEIFRVRGSHVGQVSLLGETDGTVTTTGRFIVQSRTSYWDFDQVDLGAGLRDRTNRGKSIVEFVLDSGGVTPINVADQLNIGFTGTVNLPDATTHTGNMLGFLRIKLSEPTTKGSGTYDVNNNGVGDLITLFKADRITTAITGTGTEADQGRFFDPDHPDVGIRPNSALFDGTRVLADYAGAQYSWQINYFEGSGGSDDNIVDPAVMLSGLQITGIPGDLNHDSSLNSSDRTALQAAIAAPPVIAIDGAQNLYDLNADGVVDNLDLTEFNALFLPASLVGDYNGNGIVDAADYTVWRDHLGQTFSLQNRDSANGGVISQADYTSWVNNFGNQGAGAGLGSGGAVPEPSTLVLALVGVIGLAAYRREIA